MTPPQDRRKFAELGATIPGAILALGYSVRDIEAGRWTPPELENLARSMDKLAEQLRVSAAVETDEVVIESARTDR
ncbi:hypothetical protein SAMN05421805_1011514 [Saccharopolyspora antimicrobica]|uniref:Uncharacterized protein n=1 Tax=Saccharopolyspora antimicrobica TaxID=455193 RepID=A0A1I4TP85_9PSEU|nr:hypothetical protein [Saccharopolyspora antimicrobica]RKT88493.1 hypothetical protein ATL45_6928 [Saccharopolyspora antimicrobica]SFM78526.1 hypothetical protein SAMN05421805_1011514 [Saccharopolyspora antimicrobica]